MNARQRELESIIKDIKTYMAMLYKEDPKKFRERTTSFNHLQNLLAQAANPKAYGNAGFTVESLISFCTKEIASFKGKGGRQAYAGLLTNLKDACSAQKGAGKLLKTDLKSAASHSLDESKNIFIGHNTILLRKVKKYIGVIEKEIAQAEKGGLFSKKINLSLSKNKKNIAEDLQIALQDYIKRPDKDELKKLLTAIVDSDVNHQDALKGEIGGSKRLGKLITELKETMQYYAPLEFDIAVREGEKKHQSKNSIDLY